MRWTRCWAPNMWLTSTEHVLLVPVPACRCVTVCVGGSPRSHGHLKQRNVGECGTYIILHPNRTQRSCGCKWEARPGQSCLPAWQPPVVPRFEDGQPLAIGLQDMYCQSCSAAHVNSCMFLQLWLFDSLRAKIFLPDTYKADHRPRLGPHDRRCTRAEIM